MVIQEMWNSSIKRLEENMQTFRTNWHFRGIALVIEDSINARANFQFLDVYWISIIFKHLIDIFALSFSFH